MRGNQNSGYGGAWGNNAPTPVVAIGGRSFSRHSLRDRIVAELAEASRNKERVIFGLDFQFAWPTHLRNFAGINNTPWRKALSTLNHGLNGVPPLDIPIRYCKAFNQFANQDVFWSHTFAHNYTYLIIVCLFRRRSTIASLNRYYY